jgi:PIN domain nuclease of toxin-antitoxin system
VRLLLDTCTFLWIITEAPDLSKNARDLFLDPGNDVFLSTVSIWEIVVKYCLGKLLLPEPPDRFIRAQRESHVIEPLALDEESTLHLTRLPDLHRDPFGRMLICQAIRHGLVLLTPDHLNFHLSCSKKRPLPVNGYGTVLAIYGYEKR